MNAETLADFIFFSQLASDKNESKEEVIGLLSPSLLRALKETPIIPCDTLVSDAYSHFLTRIHFEWVEYLISSYTQQDQQLLLSAFSFDLQKNRHQDALVLTPYAKRFIQNTIYDRLLKLKEGVRPYPVLTHEPLFFLLQLDADTFPKFLFGLGLYDIKEEIKTVIDPHIRAALIETLGETFLPFLKKIQSDPASFSYPPLGLKFWNGSKTEFDQLIKMRGLNRLAKASANCHQSLSFHLGFLLPIADANRLHHLIPQTIEKKIFDALKTQIQETFDFFFSTIRS